MRIELDLINESNILIEGTILYTQEAFSTLVRRFTSPVVSFHINFHNSENEITHSILVVGKLKNPINIKLATNSNKGMVTSDFILEGEYNLVGTRD